MTNHEQYDRYWELVSDSAVEDAMTIRCAIGEQRPYFGEIEWKVATGGNKEAKGALAAAHFSNGADEAILQTKVDLVDGRIVRYAQPHAFSIREWAAFLAGVESGEFENPPSTAQRTVDGDVVSTDRPYDWAPEIAIRTSFDSENRLVVDTVTRAEVLAGRRQDQLEQLGQNLGVLLSIRAAQGGSELPA